MNQQLENRAQTLFIGVDQLPLFLSGRLRVINLPDDAKVVTGFYDPRQFGLGFIITSGMFEPVPAGMYAPTMIAQFETVQQDADRASAQLTQSAKGGA